jgi:hypothetical protein
LSGTFKLLTVKIIIEGLNLGIGEIIAGHSDDAAVYFLVKFPKRKFMDRFSDKRFFLTVIHIMGDEFPLPLLSVTQMAPYPARVMVEPCGIFLFGNKRLRKRECRCQKQ